MCCSDDAFGVVVSSLASHTGDPGLIPRLAYRQFGFLPKMEVCTCYNSQKSLQQMSKHIQENKPSNGLTKHCVLNPDHRKLEMKCFI